MKSIILFVALSAFASFNYDKSCDCKLTIESRYYKKGKLVKVLSKEQIYSLPNGVPVYVNNERVKCDSISYVPVNTEQ